MIKGKTKSRLTKEAVLARIDTYDIYRLYQGPFKVNEVCVNRHRGEKDPSLIIGNKVSGGLTHKDFGDYNWRGDAFHFVQQIFGCDFPTALRHIDKDFNLGLHTGQVVEGKKIITWEKPLMEIKRPPLFQVVYYSKMNQAGLDYWAKFGQTQEDLERERIYQPKEIWRNRKKMALGNLLTFVYEYPEIGRWKIYRPFAPKRDDKTPMNQWKWDSNVPFDHVDNVGSITEDCQRVFLTKSKKDRMVLMKALNTTCMVDVQAEDAACLSTHKLELLKAIPERWIISDNDKKGKEFSMWLTKQHGFRHVNVPDKYLTSDPKCTDFADLCYHHGMQTVIDHFKRKGVI